MIPLSHFSIVEYPVRYAGVRWLVRWYQVLSVSLVDTHILGDIDARCHEVRVRMDLWSERRGRFADAIAVSWMTHREPSEVIPVMRRWFSGHALAMDVRVISRFSGAILLNELWAGTTGRSLEKPLHLHGLHFFLNQDGTRLA